MGFGFSFSSRYYNRPCKAIEELDGEFTRGNPWDRTFIS
jgi:hypothetical protein